MFNLLKSDLFRMVRGKGLWVCLVVSLVCAVLFTVTYIPLINAGGSATITVGVVSNTLYAEDTLDQLQVSFFHMFATMVLTSPTLLLLTLLLVATTLGSDFKMGFMRNERIVRTKRSAYYAEKLLLAALIVAFMLIASLVVDVIAAPMLGLRFQSNDGVDFLVRLLLEWLTFTAYAYLVAVVLFLSRKRILGVTSAVALGLYVINFMVASLLTALATAVPALSGIQGCLLLDSTHLLRDGSLALGDIALQVSCTSMAVIVACVLLSVGIIGKRDL